MFIDCKWVDTRWQWYKKRIKSKQTRHTPHTRCVNMPHPAITKHDKMYEVNKA